MMMVKRLIAILMAAVLLISAAVGVSADDFIPLADYGVYRGSNDDDMVYVGHSSGSFPGIRFLYPFWGISNVKKGYTYELTFSCKSSNTFLIDDQYLGDIRYWTNGNIPTKYSSLIDIPSASFTVTEVNGTYYYKVAFNTDLMDVVSFPDTLYVFCCNNISGNGIYLNISITDWSYSYYYDPNGDDYLKDIRDQLHAGDDYTPPDSAASSLDNSVGGLTSAEGALKDKSSSLMESVDSQMTENVTKAKALVATLKPAAVQINNVYNSFLTVLPDEIKAMFVAIPLLLFVGWLIGRIRE